MIFVSIVTTVLGGLGVEGSGWRVGDIMQISPDTSLKQERAGSVEFILNNRPK